MPGADEGDDVRPHLDVGQALAGFRIRRLEQQGQKIARRGLAGEERLSGLDQLVDRLLEEADRGTRPQAPIRGTQSGKPKMSSGSIGPRLLK